ncbi:phosphotransferase enzyme family protein [Coccidioides immitis RS]|uniref:Phosphotransferase enzyme family protein n=1 Tax=Coccidioides immitis (strain RS) TaxID=246410 RepID=J3KJJ8_COCIM|nr:phosphotransferase enzyme family protein [Coccidioides immitis RS]EAS36249.3 phosphotransferase enzyme family protein [Coccidioides immitis RS]
MDQRQGDFIDSKHDLDALNRFTSGRWLWNERQQLAARYVKFNITKLLKLAAASIGSESCAEVVKLSEGQYNKVFQLTMHDGREVIAKLPNPNAGRLHFTTASEVATMDFLRNTLHLPVPKVHAWSSRASDNAVGAEYIIMEKQAGTMLSDMWETMRGKQKAQIVKQIVDIEKTIASTKFTKLGALYYKRDLPSSDHDTVLYVDRAGNEVHTEEFGIGPTNHRSFFDFGRGELDIDRGPWSTTTAYLEAVAHREISCVDMGLRYPLMPEGLFYGPGQYQPSASKKLSALRNYLKVAPYVLPDNRAIHVPVLWHGDLHLQNIFIDPAEPTRIVGIIDWQSVSICPLFMQVTMPGFLDYNGPIPKELGRVSLPPNFGFMTPDEQRKAKELRQAQTLHNLYLALSRQINPTAFQAIKGQDSLRHQVSVVPGLTITDSEPCLTGLLREVEKGWSTIVGNGPDGLPSKHCPLRFSAAEVEQQEHDEKLWAQGVDLMNHFINETGCFKHWDGRVSNEDYEVSKRQLAEGIESFLSREARSQEERKAWLKALPFVD